MSEDKMVITEVDDTSSTNPVTFDEMELTNKFKDDNHATEVQEELASTKQVSFHEGGEIMQLSNPKTYQISENLYQILRSYRQRPQIVLTLKSVIKQRNSKNIEPKHRNRIPKFVVKNFT